MLPAILFGKGDLAEKEEDRCDIVMVINDEEDEEEEEEEEDVVVMETMEEEFEDAENCVDDGKVTGCWWREWLLNLAFGCCLHGWLCRFLHCRQKQKIFMLQ